ncbi:magnesium transporter [Amaricoccus sp.]|uniref:magnesium transporter n=1 Tax=Amaricoccus sp. TaxID=1872485 RepID=UPI00260FA5FC|nr:magnesium transporter [Amaricoccus sp.]HRO10088.1 magnesium transporter [Amaricoccus sp.]
MLTPEFVEAVLGAVEAGDHDGLVAALEPLHEADIADLLEQISKPEREALVRVWGKALDGAVLSELEEGVRDEVVAALSDDVLAAAVQDLETDDVVYLAEDMEAPEQERILRALDEADRAAVEQSLKYGEDSAGRLMQREVVVAPEHWTVGDAIDFMRAEEWLPESFYDIIIVDPHMHPVGMVALGRLMGAGRKVRLKELMDEDFRTIRADQPQEDVAYLFNKYHLTSAPVVDADGRLVGVITIDDAMEALDEEAEEDILRLAGVGDEELSDGVFAIARARFVWLAINLGTAIVSATVISQFTDTIRAFVALAVLMPIVASMGGNAGTQALTVTVRAIATRSLGSSNVGRFVRREVLVGFCNGIAFACLIGLIAGLFFQDVRLGAVIAVAMVGNMVVAGFAGALVPIGLEKLGVDPALASATFVTTTTDVFGFFAFLGLATLLLA